MDLAVLDLKLPDVDGLELLERIRRVSPHTRVLMMSAYATPQNIAKAREHGVDGILPKPFDLQDLLRRIERQLDRP